MASATSSATPSASSAPFSVFLDDTLPSLTYFPFSDTFGNAPNISAGWNPYFSTSAFASSPGETGDGTSFHVTALDGAGVEVVWSGTSLTLFGSAFPSCSSADSCTSFTTTIDGVDVSSNGTLPSIPTSTATSSATTSTALASFTGLENVSHTMRLIVHPPRNPASGSTTTDPAFYGIGTGAFFALDKIQVDARPPSGPTTPPDLTPAPPRAIPDNEVAFLGQWSVLNITDVSSSAGTFGDAVTGLTTTNADGQVLMHRSQRIGDRARVVFQGTTLAITGMTSPTAGSYSVSVETVPSGTKLTPSSNSFITAPNSSDTYQTSTRNRKRKKLLRRRLPSFVSSFDSDTTIYLPRSFSNDADSFNVTLTARSSFSSPATQLFIASGLDPSLTHQVTVTNVDGGELTLRVGGFVVVDVLPPSASPSIPVSTGALPTSSAAVPSGNVASSSFPKGTIAALILAGILAFLLLACGLGYFCLWKPRKQRRVTTKNLAHARGLRGVSDDDDSMIFRHGHATGGAPITQQEKNTTHVGRPRYSDMHSTSMDSDEFNSVHDHSGMHGRGGGSLSLSFNHAAAMSHEVEGKRGSGSTGFRRWRDEVTGRGSGKGLLGLGLVFAHSSGSASKSDTRSTTQTTSNKEYSDDEQYDKYGGGYGYHPHETEDLADEGSVLYNNLKPRKHDKSASRSSSNNSGTPRSFTLSLPSLKRTPPSPLQPPSPTQLQDSENAGPYGRSPPVTDRESEGRLLGPGGGSGSHDEDSLERRRRRVSSGLESGDDALRGLSPRTSEVTMSAMNVSSSSTLRALPTVARSSPFSVNFPPADSTSPVAASGSRSQAGQRPMSGSGLSHVRFEGYLTPTATTSGSGGRYGALPTPPVPQDRPRRLPAIPISVSPQSSSTVRASNNGVPSTIAPDLLPSELPARTSFLDFGGGTPESSIRTSHQASSSASGMEAAKSEKSRWSAASAAPSRLLSQSQPSLPVSDRAQDSTQTSGFTSRANPAPVPLVPARHDSTSTESSGGSGAQFVTVPSTGNETTIALASAASANAFPVSLPPSPHHPHTVRMSMAVPPLDRGLTRSLQPTLTTNPNTNTTRNTPVHPTLARLSLDTTSPTDSVPMSVSDIHFAHSETESSNSSGSNNDPGRTSLPAHPPLPGSASSFLVQRVLEGSTVRSPLTPVTRFEHAIHPPTPSASRTEEDEEKNTPP